MSFLTTLADIFVPKIEPLQTRESEFASFEAQLAAIRAAQNQPRPWRQASVNEALGVPAILSAVSLISGTVGSLSMEAYRNGSLVTDTNQVPRLIVRPNPKSTPGEFWMRTAFYQATRGEFWWWVAHRDIDGNPDALYPVPPWEVIVEQNDRDRTQPVIKWLNKVIPNADMRHGIYLPSTDGLRGVGPLQLAGAAVSVTVEASQWASNFFAGSLPSLIGTTDQDLDENDLKALDAQWAEKPGNLPRWMTNNMKLEAPPFDAQKAQLTESRSFQVGEVARMFLIPGPLLEFQMSGQSLTYRNEADIWTDFQRRCLSPKYLEPIEQEMSDQLPRTTAGRFNLDQLLRADVKTRFDVYGIGIDKGIFGPEYPQAKEGILPGAIDFAPVPFSPPSAELGPIPFQRSTAQGVELRCQHPYRGKVCNYLLADMTSPPYKFRCHRCKAITEDLSTPVLEDVKTAQAPQVFYIENQAAAPAPPAEVRFEAGAIKVENNVEAADLTPLERPAPPMAIEMNHPDIGRLADAVDKLENRPNEVTVDSHEFAAAIIDLKAELARRKEIVRDANGRIVAVK